MAEAHSAVAFQFAVTNEGIVFHINNDALVAVILSSYRESKRRATWWFNRLTSGYPSSHTSLFGILFAVFFLQVYESRCKPLIHDVKQNYLKNFASPPFDSLLLGFGIWVVFSLIRKYMLRLMLLNLSFLYDNPRKPSFNTKVWFLFLRILSGRKKNLFSFQSVLPRMRLPSLHETLTRHLLSVKPLVSSEKYEQLAKMSEDFEKNLGPRLQFYLWLKSWFSSNWCTDWWETYVYLSSRTPIMINSNYYGLECVLYPHYACQAARAANICYSLFKFRQKIETEDLKPILVQGARPLCSSQYIRAFNTTRIPGVECDKFQTTFNCDHIAVYYEGCWYKMNIYHNGKIQSPADFQKLFQYILDDSTKSKPGEKYLGALTTLNRTDWANARQKYFLSSPVNNKSLQAIETAAFVVVLDPDCVNFDTEDPEPGTRWAREGLHGKGYNKWFDKSFTLTIFKNGRMCSNVEHAWGDAPISAQMIEYVMCSDLLELRYTKEGNTYGTPSTDLVLPNVLTWQLSDDCVNVVNQAKIHADKLIEDVDLRLHMFKEFGKRFIKKCKLSPDGFIQMALQLAYYRDVGQFDLTYEASMTRLFRDGRTETVRSCTVESSEFVMSIVNGAPKQESLELLRRAVSNHQRLYRDAMCGYGIDRHFFGLYVVAKYLKEDERSSFLSTILSEPWRLSTSQTPLIQMNLFDIEKYPEMISCSGGFGPVSHDGYGVSYIVSGEDLLFFHVSSKYSSSRTDSKRFCSAIATALQDMHNIFT